MKERYHISGMTCSACSAHVEKAANKLGRRLQSALLVVRCILHNCFLKFASFAACPYLSFLISSTASSTTAVLPFLISSTTQVSMCSCRIT